MPREITSHKINECNERIKIAAEDAPGPNGASCVYQIVIDPGPGHVCAGAIKLHFQNGPIKEVGTNGITHEVLLAILEDRLLGFQKGPFACSENERALNCIQTAQEILRQRTLARLARGVEGTHKI